MFRQYRQRILRRPARQQRISFARQQRPSILFLHHGKLRRQTCFEWKATQKRLRETMER